MNATGIPAETCGDSVGIPVTFTRKGPKEGRGVRERGEMGEGGRRERGRRVGRRWKDGGIGGRGGEERGERGGK